MTNQKKTKNDLAWEKIFQKDNILNIIEKQGIVEIASERLNQERESRLMAKFDRRVNLPQIFREHSLSILPISRNKYAIGHFETYCNVTYNNQVQVEAIDFIPEIESIDYTNLYSEMAALNCAFNTGIIDRLFDEEMLYTVSGRMSSERFKFKILNIKTHSYYDLYIKNSQCEIDAGFEGATKFLIIEAKLGKVEDFMIRQLYYPYRLWSSKISKPVIPILMTYSNDIFSFFIYNFDNDLDYNSIRLLEQKNYSIEFQDISRDDFERLWHHITIVPEPAAPFPQANNFERVIDLLSLLVENSLSKEEITENYQFDIRQTHYYTDAARYLGLIEKSSEKSNGESVFNLTNSGCSILKSGHKAKTLKFIQKILEHQVFYQVFKETLRSGEVSSIREIQRIMAACNLRIKNKTISRRAGTVRSWVQWILSQIE